LLFKNKKEGKVIEMSAALRMEAIECINGSMQFLPPNEADELADYVAILLSGDQTAIEVEKEKRIKASRHKIQALYRKCINGNKIL
jgi:hypothetical protein